MDPQTSAPPLQRLHESAAEASRPALRGATVPAGRLDPATREAMWRLFDRYYQGSSKAAFERDLAEKSAVILLRDVSDGSLQGFSTLLTYPLEHEGRRVRLIYSGDTVVERRYWGQTELHRRFLRYCARQYASAPRTPLYWFLISKGYRTYRILVRCLPHAWPQPERAMPAFEASLLEAAARARFGDAFDARAGLVRPIPGSSRLREGIAPLGASELADPLVRYFAERNPGHAEGTELCCLGRIDLRCVWFNVSQLLRGRRGRRA